MDGTISAPMRTLYLVAVGLLLSGCVGVTLHTGSTFYTGSYEPLEKKAIEPKVRSGDLTEQDVVRILGEPEKRSMDDRGNTVLWYKANLAWRGITLWLILPIPLVLPAGDNMAMITFGPDGRYMYTNIETADSDFIGCTIAACGHLGQIRPGG